MKFYKKMLLAALMPLLYAQAAHAAPFCMEKQGIPAECRYYDAAECRKNAQQQNGICTINLTEVHLQPGVGKYCVVNSSRISLCNYADRDSCDREATRSNAVCVDFPDAKAQPDPYKLDPNSKY